MAKSLIRPAGHPKRFRPPRKLYRIGEVIQYTGLSRQTVHNYTTMGLITETEWTPGGHRLYDESVFDQLAQIEDLKRTRTLRQIVSMLGSKESSLESGDDVSTTQAQLGDMH